MITDNNLVVSGAISAAGVVSYQNIFANGTSVLSTNTVDLGSARDVGEGEDLFLRCEIGAAVTGGTSVEIQFITADDAALSTNVTVLGTTGPIPVASLTAGARFVADPRPVIGSKGQRYIGARFVNVGNNTTGTAFADFGAEIQDGQKFYPSGFAVL